MPLKGKAEGLFQAYHGQLRDDTKFHLIHAHLRVPFLPWLCFASVNDALHRLPPLSFARTKNPLRICTCFRRNLV